MRCYLLLYILVSRKIVVLFKIYSQNKILGSISKYSVSQYFYLKPDKRQQKKRESPQNAQNCHTDTCERLKICIYFFFLNFVRYTYQF